MPSPIRPEGEEEERERETTTAARERGGERSACRGCVDKRRE